MREISFKDICNHHDHNDSLIQSSILYNDAYEQEDKEQAYSLQSRTFLSYMSSQSRIIFNTRCITKSIPKLFLRVKSYHCKGALGNSKGTKGSISK